jgi:CheY-like chemotaxis protein
VVVSSNCIDQQNLRISIVDSGSGFSTEERERIFEPFDRLDKAESNIQGAGLGLTISKHLIEAIGGEIGFESSPGEGSHFWILLPLAERNENENSSSAVSTASQPAPFAAAELGNRRILYIEDNEINFDLMETLLEDIQNLELQHALNAKSGIEMASANPPDLILMDIGLPGMDGIEAANILKSKPETRHIPIIGISAAAMKRDIERAEAAGFFAYKTKPFNIDDFMLTVERALSK